MPAAPSLKPSPSETSLFLEIPLTAFDVEYFIELSIESNVDDPHPCPIYASCVHCGSSTCNEDEEQLASDMFAGLPANKW